MIYAFSALAISLCIISSTAQKNMVDFQKTIVYGPGLNPIFHMPVRYFFVIFVDTNGNNITVSLGENFIQVKKFDNDICRVWFTVVDAHDGLYIVRFRLYASCDELNFALTASKEQTPIGSSPYHLKGPLYNEECYCPQTFDSVYNMLNCQSHEQSESDLSQFELNTINMSTAVEKVEQRFGSHPGAYSVCHYIILKNEIYRKCYGQHVGFNMFSDSILRSLTRKALLPDTEFFINLGDWPLEKTNDKVPILSWCGSDDSKDIVLPTYEITEATLEMMSRHSMDVFSVQGMAKIPWAEKENISFWRGRDSRQERLNLVKLSRKHPELLDAGITRFFFFRDVMHKYGPEVPSVPFNQFFKYKYLINIDGTVSAYRFPYLLAGNSLVFKHESPYYEFYYKLLKPWVHYVPLKQDLSDVVDKLHWAKDHDIKAQQIVKNAREFVMNNLLPADIFCYYLDVLNKYTKRLQEAPSKIPKDFERVEQPSDSCQCQHSSTPKNKNEL